MTPLQKRILLVLSLAIALTRPLALAHSLNDWDEALFSLAVQEYDVTDHHPHPPGYPLFIASAKVVHLLGLSEFRALQVVVLLGSFFLFPALVLLAREIGFSFATSVSGATLFAFLPNVWIYGGTAFSDIPSIALGLFACALLLQGRRDRRLYLLGALVLGIAAGFRLPNLLLGAGPAILATVARVRARDFRVVVAAVLLGGVLVAGTYLGAALSSGTVEEYRASLDLQREYVRKIDSWQNPQRPPLDEVAKTFFVFPIEQRQQMLAIHGLVLIGIAAAAMKRRWELLFPLVIFGPLMITAWLTLDVEAAGRYAIAYLPGYVLFAAHALALIGRRPLAKGLLTFAAVAVFVVWTWPALRLQRSTDAPAAAALLWARQNVPAGATLYVHGALGPHSAYLLPNRETHWFQTPQEISTLGRDTWLVDPRVVEGGVNFVWPREALWKVLRNRNFEASVVRYESVVQFGRGWYAEEGDGIESFRWMGREADAHLPSFPKGGVLTLALYVPIDVVQPPPTIEVWFNGVLVERFAGNQAVMRKQWTLASRPEGNDLRIATSEVAVPARHFETEDTRELGLRIDTLSWTPAR